MSQCPATLNAWTRMGYQTSGDPDSPIYCNRCDSGVEDNGDPRHPIYYLEIGVNPDARCAGCGELLISYWTG